jgi:hypothetical protein
MLKPGLINICGILGIMGGAHIGGTSDPLSSCLEKISSNEGGEQAENNHYHQQLYKGESFSRADAAFPTISSVHARHKTCSVMSSGETTFGS